ncbi:MAG: two-component regulator propeller domain-containing protein [Bacteroidota bacterium]
MGGIFKSIWGGIITWLLLVSTQDVYSQEQVSFRQLSVKEGLSQNSVVSITQDSLGYLWFATQDGLNRYDGYSFHLFSYRYVDITRTRFSLLGKVYTDRLGKVWTIPQDNRLYRYDASTESFSLIEGLEDIYTLYQDRSFRYWIGTYSQGLFVYDDTTKAFTKVTNQTSPIGTLNDIVQLPSGNILVACKNKLLEIDPITLEGLEITPKPFEGKSINFSSIAIDSSDDQWIGSYGDGLFFRNAESSDQLIPVTFSSYEGYLAPALNILKVFIDSQGRLWIGTYGNGLYLIDHHLKRIRHFTFEKHNPRALHYNDILSIYEDNSGTIWLGTDGAGLSYYDEYLEKFNAYTNYLTPEAISIDVVRSIEVSPEGNTWLGTSGKGLTLYEPQTNSWATFTTANSLLPSDRIMSLHLGLQDHLWIGTQGAGLVVMDKRGDFTVFDRDSRPSLPASTLWDIYEDTQNRIWLATRSEGLIHFDPIEGVIAQYKDEQLGKLGQVGNNIRVIREDNQGKLWLGMEQGDILCFNPSTQTIQPFLTGALKDSFQIGGIKTLHLENEEKLWVGTNGQGLFQIHIPTRQYKQYTTEAGLPNNVIYAILPDSKGNLWLSSNRGISRFTPGKAFESPPTIENYDNYDGLATEYNTGAYAKDANGNLYFGGLDGFYWFQPEQIQKNPFVPHPQITGFQVLDKPYSVRPGISLKYSENTVEFTFSSMQHSLPAKNEYQYRLVNYDKDWVKANNKHYARYTQLPPGAYQFQVKSSNYDGIWNENATHFPFSISPPWYATLWAKLLYTLLTLGLIATIIRYLNWRWRMQMDLKYQEAEASRLKRINTLKSQLYTHIAHEFRTPLTLIMGNMDAKIQDVLSQGGAQQRFALVRRNARRLTGLVDQLLQLAKLEEGKLRLIPKQGNLGLFIRLITDSFTFHAEEKDIQFVVKIEGLKKAWYDEDAIEKIVTNLLSNAFKHGQKGGYCKLQASEEEGFLYLTVSNTAPNFPESSLVQLFNRFYQEDTYTEGVGIGLSLVKELVKLHEGAVTVNSEKDEITFSVKLPINRSLVGLHTVKPTYKENKYIKSSPHILLVNPSQALTALIIEDDPEVLEFVGSLLEDQYKVFEASNGKIGLNLALKYIPDIIISDLKMPDFSGIELCKGLKKDPRTSHIPVVILTGSAAEEDELKGLNAGADDYITKPFKVDVLKNRLANLISNRKALQEKYRKEVVFKPKEIAITPTDEIFFKSVQGILDQHLSDPEFNAAKFCKLVGMSRMQLHRKLQAYTGLSTSAFIRSQRIQQALQIMESSDATVSEIAYTVGFNTPSYFIKCFRERYGKTPTEYLRTL